MRVAIMQPYAFPYVGYFQLIKSVDTFVFYDDVNFIKKGYINRNQILINGESHLFTIPCKSISQNKLICDTELNFTPSDKEKFLRKLTLAYSKAPYFKAAYTFLEQMIKTDKSATISEFAIASVKSVCDYLKIEKKWSVSSLDHAKTKDLSGEERIIAIAKHENAHHYINPIGGVDLYKRGNFESQNLSLQFLKSNLTQYKQFNNDFVPWLSIVDVLMFNSIEDTNSILEDYTLL